MNPPQTQSKDEVTVLVFKDNHAARTFKISLSWLSRLGLLLAGLASITLISLFLATKYYRSTQLGDPSHARQLEQELRELRVSYQALESKKATVPAPAPQASWMATPVQGVPAPPLPPVPIPTVTVTFTPQATNPGVIANSTPALLFSALPAGTQLVSEPAKIPISVDSLKAGWSGRTLRVRFAIHYVREDNGSQQGRIIILARGPETFLAHPPGVLQRAGSESLLSPNQGEYFSVSRFREVKAEFGPMSSTSALQDIEIILLNATGQIMIHQTVRPEASSSSSSLVKPRTTNTPSSPVTPTPPAASSQPEEAQ